MSPRRPPPPFAVKRPSAIWCATALFLGICLLELLPLPYPFSFWFVHLLFWFAAAAAFCLLCFPAKRATYVLTSICLLLAFTDAVTLFLGHATDLLADHAETPWALPLWGHFLLVAAIGYIAARYCLGEATRRYYGYLDGRTVRLEVPRLSKES
ncbi:MAG: hypothetical protein ACR2OZ_02010 [Verrucomicrobiales bacterium]